MSEHLLRMPGMTISTGGLCRFRAEIVGFLAGALSADGARLLVASPFWSAPNLLIKAAASATTWKKRLAETKVIVASVGAARRVLLDIGKFRPWRLSVYVCPGLHAKLVLSEGDRSVKALVGSANMTSAGMLRRLETVIQLDFTPEGATGCGLMAVRDAILLRSVQFDGTKEAI